MRAPWASPDRLASPERQRGVAVQSAKCKVQSRCRAGAGTLLGASMSGAKLNGSPDARDVYYHCPTNGDGAVPARLDNLAAGRARRQKTSMSPFSLAGKFRHFSQLPRLFLCQMRDSPADPECRAPDFDLRASGGRTARSCQAKRMTALRRFHWHPFHSRQNRNHRRTMP